MQIHYVTNNIQHQVKNLTRIKVGGIASSDIILGRIYKLYIIRGVKNCPTMIKVCIVSQVQYIVQVG